jgi:cation-transporting P-type ATPase E
VCAGMDMDKPAAGSALDDLDDPALDRLVARTTVFGRVAPEQKGTHRGLTASSGPLRRHDRRRDQRRLARFVIPAAVITAGYGTAVYAFLCRAVYQGLSAGRTPAQVISFTSAAATIGAQTGLSTSVCLASFLLILFLAPPARAFAAWTRPVADRRPALLVIGLLVAFAAVLFVQALSSYFGLTSAAPPVFRAVLPALALWFVTLTAAFRLRLLDRILGLGENGLAR